MIIVILKCNIVMLLKKAFDIPKKTSLNDFNVKVI